MDVDMIDLNLNGRVFRLARSTFKRLPDSCFESCLDSFSRQGEIETFYLERHAESFEAILWYFTNGELHMPNSVCPAVFKRELEFWMVEPMRMSQCCYMKYVSFFEDQKLLKTFEEDETKSIVLEKRRKIGSSRVETLRRKVWRVLDDPSSSYMAKIYMVISAFFILLSIFVLCASTHPTFQRKLDLAEWEVYYGGEPEMLEQLKSGQLKQLIDEKDTPGVVDSEESHRFQKSIYQRNISSNEKRMAKNTKPAAIKNNNVSNIGAKNLNSSDIIIESLPNNTISRSRFLDIIDYGMVTYFGLELTIRFIFCPRKSKFFLSLLNIIDLIALSSECCIMLVEYLLPKEKYTIFSPLDIIECIQIARVFRLFRLVKNFIGFRILVYSVRASLKNMLLMMFNLVVAALIFSTVVFYCDRATFMSIPDAIWWSIVTMTTVGYGDTHPTNTAGKIIGCLCAISGIFVIAVSIPVLVNNYLLFTGFANLPIKRTTDDLSSLLKYEFETSKMRQHSKEKEPIAEVECHE